MSSYNELLALIDAYINQNGVQAITGQVLNGVLRAMVDQLGRGYAIMGAALPNTDPGTPDAPESWFASTPGTYTNFDGLTVANAELALLSYSPTDQAWTKQTLTQGIVSTSASVDNNVGTPSVTSSYVNGVLTFTFQNLKGNPGQDGDAAGFGTVSATVDGNVGTPGVSVQTSGPNTAKNMVFQFTNLKGETGVTSVVATVDNTSGSPQCAVSLSGGVLTLAFTGLKGAQGNTGSSVAYPFTIVNNLTTNDATQALSAAMGVQLESEVTQLEAEVDKDITDLETATNTKIGGPIVLKEDVSWTARSFEHPISIPRGCTISVKLIADGVTPSAGLRVRVKYVDDTLVDFTSSPLTSIGATATLTAVKNVKAITFYNNDAYTSASVKITAPFSVVGTMNTDTIRGTRTDFIKLDEQFNLYVYSDAIVDTYIDGTGGYELNNTGLVASPFVPVEQNKTYYIGGKVLAKYYAFYDEDKTYISGDNSTSGYMTQITAPANAAFIRFTGQVATYQSIVFSLNPLADTTNKYTTKDNIVLPIDISAEELTDAELLDAGNIIDRSKLTVGAYISATDGSLTPVPAQPQWVATDWCDIDATKKYSWFKLADFYAAFYDEKKAFIRGYSTGDRLPNPVTPPVNAKYARFTISNTAANAYGVYPVESCWCAADSENTQPNEFKSFVLPKEIFTEREFGTNPCDYTGKEISVFNKLLCVGDSLMYGAENVATGSPYIAAKEPLYNIPSFIKKMAGIDTTNAAHSGYTAEQWLADFSDDDLSGHDACIIQIGVNNWLTWADDEDAGIATFKSSLGDIIDLVISQNSYNDGGVLKNKIKVFVATQFPSKSYLKNTDGVSLDVLNEAIREVVAGRSDCFLLDMAVYSHSNDKLAFNRGHLTAIGYRQVAQDYCGIISKFIHDNFDLFVDVPFIGTNATQFQYSPTQI